MPNPETGGGRILKKKAVALLEAEDWEKSSAELLQLPGKQLINALFACLMHPNRKVGRRSIIAMGMVTDKIAKEDMESARVILRRLMWSLNDESGGIGWGAPEAMGAIIAANEQLAREYSSILISYMNPDGNFLEYPNLQHGLLWGIATAAKVRPELMLPAADFLPFFLDSDDPVLRGLAIYASGLLGAEKLRGEIAQFTDDTAEVSLFFDDAFETYTIKQLTLDALERIDSKLPE